jgi:hypothetical protein
MEFGNEHDGSQAAHHGGDRARGHEDCLSMMEREQTTYREAN